ncbi:lipopolysaccharide biosynthesis protein [Arachidicoccus ginsenosidimutans]|uniref:glycosyl transferase family 90 n=1 Tax=Arachidicoccus sp. BS20 TaxID=1850526 RepID=UPI0007F069D5|nr:glycosyl transferase family 90 [Arachidicoccus sp. BS20]ANI88123.1 lipopolysaccharide biosynthesis protein [Arachidicoccus sp. BS20]
MKIEPKRLSYKHKNSKILYYAQNYFRQIIPAGYYQPKLKAILDSFNLLDDDNKKKILARVNYYNKLEKTTNLSAAQKLSDLSLKAFTKDGHRSYYFDFYEYGRYFNQDLKGHFLFGDITKIPDEPAIVKSRPVAGFNENSILFKLNKMRHFMFVKNDKKQFAEKKSLLVWRGNVNLKQPHRIRFMERYFGHPMCNIGKVNDNQLNAEWKVGRMTIDEQLEYKFILSLEGNDVATNLKWIMSSNSLAVMPKPKFETWFMEGMLVPDKHYVLINDDFSDLEEKLNYYINHPIDAEEIIKNANNFIAQFKNKRMENLISLMVLDKYFSITN